MVEFNLEENFESWVPFQGWVADRCRISGWALGWLPWKCMALYLFWVPCCAAIWSVFMYQLRLFLTVLLLLLLSFLVEPCDTG